MICIADEESRAQTLADLRMILNERDKGKELESSLVSSILKTSDRVELNKNGDQSYQVPTRLTKVEFPKFEGVELENWLYHCNRFFLIDGTPNEAKVNLASLHLGDRALEWHQSYIKGRGAAAEPPWEEYERALKVRFGERIYDNPMANLKKLTQTGELMEYIEAFDVCAHKTTLSESNILDCFISGLKDELSYPVLMQGPKTLQEAYALARMHDAYLLSVRQHF